MKPGQSFALALALWASSVPLSAHHTSALLFDTGHVVKLHGTITQVDWKNPHVAFHLDVTGADGVVSTWSVDTLNIRGLKSRGLTQDSYKAGDPLDVTVCTARDGTPHAVTQSIDRPDGTMYVRVGGC